MTWILRYVVAIGVVALGSGGPLVGLSDQSGDQVDRARQLEAQASLKGLPAVNADVLWLNSRAQEAPVRAEMEILLRSLGIRVIDEDNFLRDQNQPGLFLDVTPAPPLDQVTLSLYQRVSLVRLPSVRLRAETWNRTGFCSAITTPCRQVARDLLVQFANDFQSANPKAR